METFARRMRILRHRVTTLSKESKDAASGRAPQGCGAALWLFSLVFLASLHIWATILVFRMVALGLRMATLLPS